ncbi:MAG TPA: TIGR01777 family oxidoreductase [Terriglobia bacterium]|nr:TIGR01777 family oxidoreductase [Terriglobia bacterium]
MEVAITGASGLIGSALAEALTRAGHRVARVVRTKPAPESGDIFWDPERAYVDMLKLDGKDAVVHLAGESIAARWTPEKKTRIHASRLRGTQLMAEAVRQLSKPPGVLVSASAVGYYGDRGAEVLREDSPPGQDFLAEVARDWEAATEAASRAGVRVVLLRIGIVLSKRGGALAQMLTPFRMGVGGQIGSGKQYMSWIAIDDVVGAILHVIEQPSLSGPVNVVAPHPVTNREFTKTLGKVLSRPTIAPLPAFIVKLLFGEMGEALLLSSQRVEPARLKESGYTFRYPTLEAALRHVLSE